MEFEKVKDKFGSWATAFRPFIESESFDKIFAQLISLKNRGKVICPASNQTFRCFQETPMDHLKAIFIFDDPYEQFEDGKILADGIALSCANTCKPSLALSQFYRAIEMDLSGGLNLEMVDMPNLSYLANQGILMINAALTVELNKPGSHIELWKEFMTYFLTEVVNTYTQNLPVVYAGRYAELYRTLTIPFHHQVFQLPAPGLSGTRDTPWESQGVFRKVNQILVDNGCQPVKWIIENEQLSDTHQVETEAGIAF